MQRQIIAGFLADDAIKPRNWLYCSSFKLFCCLLIACVVCARYRSPLIASVFTTEFLVFLLYVGGSLVKFLSEGLPTINTDWSKWRFFFCDERIVSFENGESTYGLYRASLIEKVPITEDQFIKINPDLSGMLRSLCYNNTLFITLSIE